MSVLDAFLSAWSNARATFGEGTAQTGEQYDNSPTLRQLESGLHAAAAGSRWTGAAASAYDTANTEHRRVVGELAGLDQQLKSQIDQSAQVVTAGRRDLDKVRTWVVDAAAGVPPGRTREQMLLPIVQKGLTDLQDVIRRSNSDLNTIGANIRGLDQQYQALGDQKFD